MDLYEYQGKELFRRFGIPVSDGRLATTPEEARAAAAELGGAVVVKAQVLVGGRGKAGGIKLAADAGEAEQRAAEILGLDIRGHRVERLWIERASEIAREYYLAVTVDRGAKRALLMFTTEGGVEIEQVAAETPELLARVHVDPLEGFRPEQADELLARVGDAGERRQIAEILETARTAASTRRDAMLCEINPLIVTPAGIVRALDSKFTIDDSALYRHPDLGGAPGSRRGRPARGVRAGEGRDLREARRHGRHPRERRGARDVDGRRRRRRRWASRQLLRPGRRGVGPGRRRCPRGDRRAIRRCARSSSTSSVGSRAATRWRAGSSTALAQSGSTLPIVVRLDGTNADEGRRILSEAAPPNLELGATMLAAAGRAVELAAEAA